MNTPTPETDAFIGDQDGTYMTEGEIAMCDFARRLERERDEARAERDLVRERALDAADVLQNAEEERDELRRDVAALLNALPNGAHDVTEGVVIIQSMRAAIKEAHGALSAIFATTCSELFDAAAREQGPRLSA